MASRAYSRMGRMGVSKGGEGSVWWCGGKGAMRVYMGGGGEGGGGSVVVGWVGGPLLTVLRNRLAIVMLPMLADCPGKQAGQCHAVLCCAGQKS